MKCEISGAKMREINNFGGSGKMKYKLARAIIRMVEHNGWCYAITGKIYPVTKGMHLYHKDIRIFEKHTVNGESWAGCLIVEIPFYFIEKWGR